VTIFIVKLESAVDMCMLSCTDTTEDEPHMSALSCQLDGSLRMGIEWEIGD